MNVALIRTYLHLQVDKDGVSNDDENLRNLARDVISAFTTVGFVYFTNHGIQETEVSSHPDLFFLHLLVIDRLSISLEVPNPETIRILLSQY